MRARYFLVALVSALGALVGAYYLLPRRIEVADAPGSTPSTKV